MSATTSVDSAHIRLADGNDLEGVVAVGRTTWPVVNGPLLGQELTDLCLDKWWTPGACIPAIRAGRTFVADWNGTIVGMASHGPLEGHEVVWKLYVRPEYQGRGVGARLLRAVIDAVRDSHREIDLSFYDGDAGAYAFARAHGFLEFAREEQEGMPDLVWMRRAIGSGS